MCALRMCGGTGKGTRNKKNAKSKATEPGPRATDRDGVGCVGCGELRSACHVIPYLDNFLQFFVEDLSVLNWPTLLREADPLMG
jgi:hypothetical protein